MQPAPRQRDLETSDSVRCAKEASPMTTTTVPAAQRSCAWLLEQGPPEFVFTPEQQTDEHRLIDQTATEFVTNEVVPHNGQLETRDWELARRDSRAHRGARSTRHGCARGLRRHSARQGRLRHRGRAARSGRVPSMPPSARRPDW